MKTNTVVLIVVIGCVICCLVTACFFCVVFVFVSNQAGGLYLGLPPQIGDLAPDFQLESIEGKQVTLTAYRGKPVLLNFWAIWCGPCQEEMPVLQERFQAHYPDFVVLAVEEGESPDELREYVDETELTFPVLMGSESLAQLYGINYYPTSIFIDADGIIRSVVVGSMSGSDLDFELKKVGVGD